MNDLRGRIRVQTDGKLQTGRDVVIAALLGRRGVRLLHRAAGRDGLHHDAQVPPEHLPGGHRHAGSGAAREVHRARPSTSSISSSSSPSRCAQYMAQMGFRTFDEMVGRVDMLDTREAMDHWKAKGLDLSTILYNPQMPRRIARRCVQTQDHGLAEALDYKLIDHAARGASSNGTPIEIKLPIRNVHRTVGAMLSRRDRAALRLGGAARRHHPLQVHRLGRAELRRVPGQGRDARARRRRQRLRRQGTLGRPADRLSAARLDVPAGGEHPHRQRGALRRDQRRGVLQRHGRRALRGAQLRRDARWWKASAITAAST